jgi:hypothetical protein
MLAKAKSQIAKAARFAKWKDAVATASLKRLLSRKPVSTGF